MVSLRFERRHDKKQRELRAATAMAGLFLGFGCEADFLNCLLRRFPLFIFGMAGPISGTAARRLSLFAADARP